MTGLIRRVRVAPLALLGEGRLIPYDGPPPYRSILVVATAEGPRAYWNICKHLPVPLDGGTNLFPVEEGDFVCFTHGARFSPDNGYCHEGPCEGDALEPVEVIVDAGVVYLDLTDAPTATSSVPGPVTEP